MPFCFSNCSIRRYVATASGVSLFFGPDCNRDQSRPNRYALVPIRTMIARSVSNKRRCCGDFAPIRSKVLVQSFVKPSSTWVGEEAVPQRNPFGNSTLVICVHPSGHGLAQSLVRTRHKRNRNIGPQRTVKRARESTPAVALRFPPPIGALRGSENQRNGHLHIRFTSKSQRIPPNGRDYLLADPSSCQHGKKERHNTACKQKQATRCGLQADYSHTSGENQRRIPHT